MQRKRNVYPLWEMSEVDHIIYRDMLPAFMGHMLVDLYGEEALEALSK